MIWRGDDRGSVVAEFAVALPAVVLVLVLGVGALSSSAQHVRLQDAVADAARLAARGEPVERVHAVVADAVAGASSSIEARGDLVCVIGSAPSSGLPLTLTASSCALAGGL
ncbi:TadE family type IV pilus minor pilin [Microbacterium pumilum]|uniref:TadE-like domain-containing protein n=1 Tax=Microbacterium pumilum TaxID=344165 RepID=A0ABN2SZE4_9MICO